MELIDKKAILLSKLCEDFDCEKCLFNEGINCKLRCFVAHLAPVDAVPVVRCADCRFYDNNGAKIGKCGVWDYWTKTGDFCFFGETEADDGTD